MPEWPRVAMVAGTFRPDHCGVAHYTARLSAGLRAAGVETALLTTHAAAEQSGDGAVGVVDGWSLGALRPLARVVRALHPDLVHVQYAPATYRFHRAIALLPLALELVGWRGPLVTTLHEYGGWSWEPALIPPLLRRQLLRLGEARGWWDRETGLLLSRSRAIVTTNATAEEALAAWLPGARARLVRLPICANVEVAPVERSRARAPLRARFGWEPESAVLAFFGFVHPVKGLETLVRASALLCRRGLPVRLLVIGGTESLALAGAEAAGYLTQLQSLVGEHGLEGHVVFTGFLEDDDASRLLAGADLAVLPFNHGATLKSGSLLTALGHGLPVITTEHQPPEPELSDDQLARLVPPRDPAALADAVAGLLTDAHERARLASAGHAFVERRSWTATIERHLALYQHLLDNEVSAPQRARARHGSRVA